MAHPCRYCGTRSDDLASADEACPQCAASPDCGRCGHPRSGHVGLLRDGRGCAHVWVEEPATLVTGCTCAGFVAVAASLDEELMLVVEGRHGDTPVPVVPGR
jgi:hypothetical protein